MFRQALHCTATACFVVSRCRFNSCRHTHPGWGAQGGCLCSGLPGLMEDTEVESMKGLVDQKLKKLHYFPPAFRVQPPHTLLAAHPLLADVPPPVFRGKAGSPLIHGCDEYLVSIIDLSLPPYHNVDLNPGVPSLNYPHSRNTLILCHLFQLVAWRVGG